MRDPWRIVGLLILAVLVVWAISAGEYFLVAVVVGIAVGSDVAVRLGSLNISTAPFWALVVTVPVLCLGLAALPFMPRLVGITLIAGGLFTALTMPLQRYEDDDREQVD